MTDEEKYAIAVELLNKVGFAGVTSGSIALVIEAYEKVSAASAPPADPPVEEPPAEDPPPPEDPPVEPEV